MKMVLLAFALTVAALPSWAGPGDRLDGIRIGQPAGELRWLDKTSGKFKHDQTTVEVKEGEVVTIWGEHLVTQADQEVRLGQAGQSALKILGRPDGGTLYGCGTTSQQIHFFKSQGLDLTVTDGKVTAIRLYRKPR